MQLYELATHLLLIENFKAVQYRSGAETRAMCWLLAAPKRFHFDHERMQGGEERMAGVWTPVWLIPIGSDRNMSG